MKFRDHFIPQILLILENIFSNFVNSIKFQNKSFQLLFANKLVSPTETSIEIKIKRKSPQLLDSTAQNRKHEGKERKWNINEGMDKSEWYTHYQKQGQNKLL